MTLLTMPSLLAENGLPIGFLGEPLWIQYLGIRSENRTGDKAACFGRWLCSKTLSSAVFTVGRSGSSVGHKITLT